MIRYCFNFFRTCRFPRALDFNFILKPRVHSGVPSKINHSTPEGIKNRLGFIPRIHGNRDRNKVLTYTHSEYCDKK